MKILVIGGAGFLGGFLTESLVRDGFRVDVLDNFHRGVNDSFLSQLLASKNVNLLSGDIRDREFMSTLGRDYDVIYHMAAIIGVRHVLERPYEVLVENARMLEVAIELARMQVNLKRFLFTSTSEVYGDPLIHPQVEEYYGNVNTIGERSCYDESKRLAETIIYEYKKNMI